jgi:hypothetical protein
VAAQLATLVAAVDEVVRGCSGLHHPLAQSPRPAAVLSDEILVLQRQINRLSAAMLERVAAFDALGGAQLIAGATTSSWLRHRAGLPAGQSSDLVRTARSLRDELPRTQEALRAGDVTTQHARTIVHAVHQVTDNVTTEEVAEATAEVERVMLEVGRSVDVGSLNGFAKRIRQIVDPDGVLADANRAHDRRWLTAARTMDGMVDVAGLLDPESGAVLITVLASGSTPTGPGDTRSGGQRRADALTELCRQSLDRGEVPSTGGVTPHLLVTTTLDSLKRATHAAGGESADMEWAGPIPPESARRLACDATLTRVLVDPEGLPLDIGRATRVVPPAIRTALVIRDGGCVADCCDRPAAWSEAHHITHWIDGGDTALDNLVLLCRTHHRMVHEEGWRIARDDGRLTLAPP